jgi:hypothetical protein
MVSLIEIRDEGLGTRYKGLCTRDDAKRGGATQTVVVA